MDQQASPRTSEAAATSAAPPTRRLSRLVQFIWPLVCLFQLGLIVAAFAFGSRLAAPEPTPAPMQPANEERVSFVAPWPQEPLEPERAHAARGELDEVDRLLRIGRPELALALCRAFGDRATTELRDSFQYRLSLCLEGVGRWDEALVAYRKLASQTTTPRTAALAQIGQARTWLRMRHPTESKALLCDLLRRSAQPGLRGQAFLADARYLLALAAPLELLPNELPGPFHDNPVSPLAADWSLDRALDWDRPRSGVKKESQDSSPPLEEAEIVEAQPGATGQVRIFVHQMAVTGLLDRLAEQARLRIDWSARARQQVEGRSVLVALEKIALADALRILVEPLGLVWDVQGEKLSFSSEEEASAEQLRTQRWSDARRALREAVSAHPNHPLTPTAFLELGDLEALAGHLDEALAWYSRLIREWPRSPLAIEGHFNLGLVRIRQGDRSAARQAFYRVVDRAPAHELTPLAYWRVGRIYLEEGDPEKALSPLRRALRCAPGSPVQAAAVLTIAAAHLLTDNPRAANAVLLEHHDLIDRDEYRPAAVFLDTLARFRAAADHRQRQREAGDLLTALLSARDHPLLGTCGLLLMGQAYQEMGMTEEMIRVYEKVLPLLRGPLAGSVTLAAADAYRDADKYVEAIALYNRVLAAGPSAGARRARLRLAEFALIEKKPQDCLKSCRELLQEKTGADVAPVLRLMARAYEQLGERDKAIRCLEGQLP